MNSPTGEYYPHHTPVANSADIFERPQPVINNHTVDKTLQNFWRLNGTGDTLQWFREGQILAESNTSKTGNDLLIQIVRLAIPHIIKKYMRANEQKITSKMLDLITVLDVIHTTLLDDSVNTVSVNESRLEQEDVLAFLQGFLTQKYENNRLLYED